MTAVAYAYLPTAVALGGHDGGAPGLGRHRWSAGAPFHAHDAVVAARRLPRGGWAAGGCTVGGVLGHPARVRAPSSRGGLTMMASRRKGRGTRVPPIPPSSGPGRLVDGKGGSGSGSGGDGVDSGGGGGVSSVAPLPGAVIRGRLPRPSPPSSLSAAAAGPTDTHAAAAAAAAAPSDGPARGLRAATLRRRPLDGKWDRVSFTLGGRGGGSSGSGGSGSGSGSGGGSGGGGGGGGRGGSRGGKRHRHSVKSRSAVAAAAAEDVGGALDDVVFSGKNNLAPDSCPALVLNADYQPLSYLPLSLWPWQEVIKAVYMDRVQVVAVYPNAAVRSPGRSFELPSVIALREYRPVAGGFPAFTRFNLFLRDDFTCQYCGQRFPTHDLTFDHVVPRCQGGRSNWQNVVAACVNCNHRKGNRTLAQLKRSGETVLRRTPVQPTNAQLQVAARRYPPRYCHLTWRDYLYWDTELTD